MKVFVGGSRAISRLNAQLRTRLENILSKEMQVLIGDAKGADKAVQKFLMERHYSNVQVFCSDGDCRNNVGNWEKRSIPADTQQRTYIFYSAKDRIMAQEADAGLMIWDGKSVGTLLNVFRLLNLGKLTVLYIVPEKQFLELRYRSDWAKFIGSRDVSLREKIEKRAALESPIRERERQRSLFG